MPVETDYDDHNHSSEWYIFSLSDNDFITTNGFMDGGKVKYIDIGNNNNQALVFKVTLPKGIY